MGQFSPLLGDSTAEILYTWTLLANGPDPHYRLALRGRHSRHPQEFRADLRHSRPKTMKIALGFDLECLF